MALAIEGASIGLWLHDLDRGVQTRFSTGYNNSNPVWAPDGDRLAFMSQVTTGVALHWKPVDGSGDGELLLTSESAPVPSTWSPDGEWFLMVDASQSRVFGFVDFALYACRSVSAAKACVTRRVDRKCLCTRHHPAPLARGQHHLAP